MKATPLPSQGLPEVAGKVAEKASRGFYIALGTAGVATVAAAARTVWPLPMVLFQALLALAGCAWGYGLYLAARGRGEVRVTLWMALLVRVGVLGVGLALSGPDLSDDVQRYGWEGRVLAAGYSPYAFAPDDERLDEVRAQHPELAASVGHAEIPAVYPPAAQYWHALVMSIAAPSGSNLGSSVAPLRVAYAALDLLVLWPLLRLLRRRGQPGALIVAWGASPLVALSYAGTGHVDALAILALVLALDASQSVKGCGVRCGAWLGLGVASKYLPLIAFPALWLRSPRRWRLALGLGAACVLLFAPILGLKGGEAGWSGGLATYGTSWQGGSLVFRWVDQGVRAWEGLEGDPRLVARRLLGVLWCLVFVWSTWRQRDPVRAVGAAVCAYLVLSPTLHPWYLTWALPFLALDPRASWTVLLIGAPLLWWPVEAWQGRGEWIEPSFVWPLMALPFLALRGVEMLRAPHSKP